MCTTTEKALSLEARKMDEIKWEKLELKQENAKELPLDFTKEPTKKDYIKFMCYAHFGGVCNEEEIEQITDIVYKAYQRIQSDSQVEINKNCKTVKVRRI